MSSFHNKKWVTMFCTILLAPYYASADEESQKEVDSIFDNFGFPLGEFLESTKKAIMEDNVVSFVLYNEDNDGVKLEDEESQDDWENKFADSQPCVFLAHGWRSNIDEEGFDSVIKAYKKMGNVNLVLVDWRDVAQGEYIILSTTIVPKIGDKLGALLKSLSDDGKCDLSEAHLIGHSLGAHIMGIAGKYVKDALDKQVNRITGLDPAGPVITWLPPGARLTRTDANFVDVIHTDSITGVINPIGHADFYPDGGIFQPRCLTFYFAYCNRKQAFTYYADSIKNSTGFPAKLCPSSIEYLFGECENNDVAYMGYGADPSTRGIYYLTITESTLEDSEEGEDE